jgi:hydrogenase maturation protease
MKAQPCRVKIIALGNPLRGDDGLGVHVLQSVNQFISEEIEILNVGMDCLALMDIWEGAELAVVVDAMKSGSNPGVVKVFDATENALPSKSFRSTSSHALGIGEMVELGRVLGRLPKRLVVIGVEGKSFKTGEGISAEIEVGLKQAQVAILREVKSCTN